MKIGELMEMNEMVDILNDEVIEVEICLKVRGTDNGYTMNKSVYADMNKLFGDLTKVVNDCIKY